MLTASDLDFSDAPALSFKLRDYQVEAVRCVNANWGTYRRQLLDMATGSGKSSIMAALAAERWAKGQRTLILENRDALVRQTAKRIIAETGIGAEIEMASEMAGPSAPIVVASVQTLCRTPRLLSFAANHFAQLIIDEGHHSLANSTQKVISYFHFGEKSLAEDWKMPEMGVPYEHHADVLAVTATPELNGSRSLSELYETVAYTYQLLQAIRDGWLVPIVAKNMKLDVDLRGLRAGRTPNGSDLKAHEVAERMLRVMGAFAKQIVELAADRKTIAFVPSVECARVLAEQINALGLRGIFVSGECLDVDEKTEEYRQAGPGTVLANCALYVEGADFPDTSCVAIGRATKSSGFFRQMVGRGTRVLPGIVEDLPTAEERRAAIAASAKPDLLLIDPLWRIDDIDLASAYDLYSDKPEVREAMKKLGPPSPETAAEAERDFIKALEREARKHARKAARVIDPIAWAVSIGDAKLASYVPQSAWESNPPTVGQLDFLKRNHIDTASIKTKGLAGRVISVVVTRLKLRLATAVQLDFLKTLGVTDPSVATLSQSEASKLIDATLAAKKRAREGISEGPSF